MELVPDKVNEKDLKDEVLRRNAKAGYTTRFGEPPYRTKIQNVVAFGEPKIRVWPRNLVTGELVDD